jgi:hypothetical protein
MNENETLKLPIIELGFVIEEAIKKLPEGESRFVLTDLPLSVFCLDGFYGPDMAERLSSNLGSSSKNDKIEAQYFEEITTLEKIMVRADFVLNLSHRILRCKSTFVERHLQGISLRGYAIQMWNWYAIPWRFDGKKVHIIYSPEDILGTPIIHTYESGHFLCKIAEQMIKHQKTDYRLNKKLSFWKNFGVIVMALFIIGIIVVIQSFIF